MNSNWKKLQINETNNTNRWKKLFSFALKNTSDLFYFIQKTE